MARPKQSLPTYRHHKPTHTGRCWVGGRWVSLGRYNSPQSRAEFARIVAELAAAPVPATSPVPTVAAGATDVTVNELILACWRHAEGHYRRTDGSPTNELTEYRQALQPLRSLYGHTPAAEFDPRALQAVRRAMVEAGLARTTINARVRRLRHVFKWAAAESLVPVTVHQALACVGGLQRGRTTAPEPEPVRPVAEEHVRAVLPFVRPPVRGMVEVQLLTGMRPDEVCRMRPCEVETVGPVWVYRPPHHKNSHRGLDRAVPIGPRAQAVLEEFLPADPADYFFSPRRAVAQLHAERARGRKTPLYPSHAAREAAEPSMAWERARGSGTPR
jgi:integrase